MYNFSSSLVDNDGDYGSDITLKDDIFAKHPDFVFTGSLFTVTGQY